MPAIEFGLALVGHADRSRPAPRARAGRLPGDRRAAVGEGLPGVGHGHHVARPIPYSSGLGFAVRSAEQFLGRDALPPAEGGPQRLVCLVLDDVRSVALGNEPVRTPDGEVVGRVTSGGQGFTTGESIAYAWVPAACVGGWHAAHRRGVRRVRRRRRRVRAALRPDRLEDPRLTRTARGCPSPSNVGTAD